MDNSLRERVMALLSGTDFDSDSSDLEECVDSILQAIRVPEKKDTSEPWTEDTEYFRRNGYNAAIDEFVKLNDLNTIKREGEK